MGSVRVGSHLRDCRLISGSEMPSRHKDSPVRGLGSRMPQNFRAPWCDIGDQFSQTKSRQSSSYRPWPCPDMRFPNRMDKPLSLMDKLSGTLQIVFGGAEGNRTPDLLNAIQALSQLSYGPAYLGRGIYAAMTGV